jgi:regulator of RNase E activity RraA
LGARPYVRVSSVNESIVVNGINVSPGDVIVGDVNGVVCIPQQQVGEVVKVAQSISGCDEKCRVDVANGMTLREAFAKHR